MKKILLYVVTVMMVLGLCTEQVSACENLDVYKIKIPQVHLTKKEKIIHFDSNRKLAGKIHEYAAPKGTNYFYDHLDRTSKYIYRGIYHLAMTHRSTILNVTKIKYADRIFLAVSLDHPDLLSYSRSLYNGGIEIYRYWKGKSKKIYKFMIKYGSPYVSYAHQEKVLKQAAKTFLNEYVDRNQPQAVIAKEIHDALILNVSYDMDVYYAEKKNQKIDPNRLALSHTAYGALINKKAVCDGYATAYQYLCHLCGIEAIVIRGNAGESGSMGSHAWSAVKLGGDWYDLDVTWDDPYNVDDYVYTNYYNLPTSQFEQMERYGKLEYHTPSKSANELSNYLPKARGTHFNAQYMYRDETLPDFTDPQNQALNYYDREDGQNMLLSTTYYQDEWNIHVLLDNQSEDPLIWKIASSVSPSLMIKENWKNHNFNVKRSNDVDQTGTIYTTIYFDNGQKTNLNETIIFDHSVVWADHYTIDWNPTCTAPGRQSIHSVDGTKIKTSSKEAIPALGHRFDRGKVIKKATVKAAGKKVYTCKVCGYKKAIVLPKLRGIRVIPNKHVKVKGSTVTTKIKTVRLKSSGLKGKITWKISNKKIAKISKGKVMFKKKGKVTVTLKCKKRSYKVTIVYK